MKITVVGSGHGGCAIASVLSMKGHQVSILKIGSILHNENFEVLKKNQKIKLYGIEGIGEFDLDCVTTDPSEVIPNSDLILIYYVSNFHPLIAERIAPFLNKEQIVAFGPGYMGSLIFEKEIRKIKKDYLPLFAEFETLPYSSRIMSPGKVDIVSKNIRHPFASYPAIRNEEIINCFEPLIGECVPRCNLFEVSLHNPNLIIHTIGVLMNISLIEAPDSKFAMYRDGFSPSIWKIVDLLDNEKMNALEKIGAPRVSYFDAFRLRTFKDISIDSIKGFEHYADEAPDGPFTIDNRYLTEDVPMGLGLLHSLGCNFQFPTPICDTLINFADALFPLRNFYDESRNVESFWDGNLKALLTKLVNG